VARQEDPAIADFCQPKASIEPVAISARWLRSATGSVCDC
jgi:hypothetical protein